MRKEIVLAGACRTAIGKMGRSLMGIPAADLGAIVIKDALHRAGISADPDLDVHRWRNGSFYNGRSNLADMDQTIVIEAGSGYPWISLDA